MRLHKSVHDANVWCADASAMSAADFEGRLEQSATAYAMKASNQACRSFFDAREAMIEANSQCKQHQEDLTQAWHEFRLMKSIEEYLSAYEQLQAAVLGLHICATKLAMSDAGLPSELQLSRTLKELVAMLEQDKSGVEHAMKVLRNLQG